MLGKDRVKNTPDQTIHVHIWYFLDLDIKNENKGI